MFFLFGVLNHMDARFLENARVYERNSYSSMTPLLSVRFTLHTFIVTQVFSAWFILNH